MTKIWFPVSIILLSIINLGHSLNFAINGDDWLALYRYNLDFNGFFSHFDIKNYITPTSNYVFGYLMMGLISKLFLYDHFPYYLTALILRIITAFSFYWSLSSVAKNKWVGYLSAIFFASMYAGIETTNWVSNMNTYVSIILLNTFLGLLYNRQSIAITFKTFLYSLLLVASFLITPVRMHGLLFLIPAITFIKFGRINKSNIFNFIAILSILLIPLILVRFLTYQDGASDYLRITTKASESLEALFNLFTNIGYSVFPNILINISQSFYFAVGITSLLILGIYFSYLRSANLILSQIGFLSLISSISFLIIPGLINPSSVFPSDHRYLIIPASWLMVALSVFVVTLFSNKKSVLKNFAVIITFSVILLNSIALQKYFYILSKEGRLAIDSDRLFTYLSNKIPYTNTQSPLVFLFVSNDNFFVYNVANFGFTPHMIVLNPYFAKDPQKAPFTVDNFDSLKSILKDPSGLELQRYGYKPVKIPLENIYSFYINSEHVEDLSDQVRKTLSNI